MKRALVILLIVMLNVNVAYAKNWAADVIKSVALGTIAYHTYLSAMMNIGEDPQMQAAAYMQDIKENGQSEDEYDLEFVNSIMYQMIEQGDYAMKKNMLPFKWNVNNNKTFNAYCTAMNYISVNKGLLTALNYNRDEVAAVLAHEMIHGLHQHVQHGIAKQAAYTYAAAPLAGRDITGVLFSIAVNYNNAKNVTAPAEKEADEYGFYLMTSAGFNPGAFAAMVTKMPNSHKETILSPDDHPETRKRLERALKWLKEYSYNHVSVHKNAIHIDDTFYKNCETYETACLEAGNIAKEFHDNQSPWRADNEILQILVNNAYKKDNDREKLQRKEQKRHEKIMKQNMKNSR